MTAKPRRRHRPDAHQPDVGKSYWNHNAAYHPWIERIARRHGGRLLDVGCGEGLLLQRLSPAFTTVVGVEIDDGSVSRARARLAGIRHATVVHGDFIDYERQGRQFDVITFVASLHHLPLRATLVRARELLAPGGDLLVVGLAARSTVLDWVLSGLALPVVRTASVLHREARTVGVPVASPHESLREIRVATRAVLPGVHIRRALYYRYLLRWTKPARS